MNKILETLITQLVPVLGQAAVDKLEAELKDLSDDQDGMKKVALSLLANAVAKFGPQGVIVATIALQDLVANKQPDLSWADLRVASDVLAVIQNADADRKSAALNFLTSFSETLGVILSGVIVGLL